MRNYITIGAKSTSPAHEKLRRACCAIASSTDGSETLCAEVTEIAALVADGALPFGRAWIDLAIAAQLANIDEVETRAVLRKHFGGALFSPRRARHLRRAS